MNRHVQHNLQEALRHHCAGRFTDAERIYRQILTFDPNHADSLHLLGMIADRAGDYAIAVELILRAIVVDPNAAAYHSNLGTILQAQRKLDDAAECFLRALALKPDLAEVHTNLGNICKAQGRLDAAVTCHRRALALKPSCAEAYSNLGCALQAQAKPDEALECYQRALALNPDYAMARFSASLVQLLKADFVAGWSNYESRWQTKEHNVPMRAYTQPIWRGENLESGRLLIWGEQGIGDEIMFAGLIPDVIGTGNRCVLDCDPRLRPLFTRSFPDADVISGHSSGSHPELDIGAHLPSGSLPGLFRPTKTAFAAAKSPYLVADSDERNRFRIQYGNSRRLVGLAWHTKNPKTGRDRSIDLARFAPLFDRTNIRWVSLQYGDYDLLESQAAAAKAPMLIDRAVEQFFNIDTFASQVSAMDLVVTIDNSAAHLAGALGVPTWLLLPFAPDWRWGESGVESHWYPTMRLLRQPRPGDWHSVIQVVSKSLSH